MPCRVARWKRPLLYGLTRAQRFRFVLFPQMMRFALPGIGNNWMVILKATALVSIIGLADLVKVAQDAGKTTYQLFFFLVLAALIYLVITTASNYVLRRRNPLCRRHPGGRAMIELLQEYWKPFLYSDGYHITGLAMTLWLLSASLSTGFLMALPLSIAQGLKQRMGALAGTVLHLSVSRYATVYTATDLLHRYLQSVQQCARNPCSTHSSAMQSTAPFLPSL